MSASRPSQARTQSNRIMIALDGYDPGSQGSVATGRAKTQVILFCIQSEIITHIRTALSFIFQHSKKPAKYKRQSNCKIAFNISKTLSKSILSTCQRENCARICGDWKSYVQHPVPRREVREKPVWEPNTAPMDGCSTSRKDYGPKEAMKQASCKPEAVAFRSTEPFDGWSTQRADYVQRPMERVQRREPETYRRPEGELDLNTTHRRDLPQELDLNTTHR